MRSFLLIILTFSTVLLSGQNIHFSQYHKSPVSFNPANTGLFKGCFRLGSNYRNQWGDINAFTLHLEESFIDKKSDITKYGIGAYLYQESAGKTGLNFTQGLFSTSIIKYIDFDKKHQVSIGVQLGFTQAVLDVSNVSFLNQYNNIDEFDHSINNNENYNSNNSFTEKFNFGFKYIFVPTIGVKIQNGFAIQNATQPNDAFNDLVNYKSAIHYIYHNELSLAITKNHSIKTLFFGDFASGNRNVIFGGMLKYNPAEEEKMQYIFEGGLFYRLYDAIIISAGISKNNHNFSISYDIISSGLNAGRGYGGNIEIGYFFTLDCKAKLPPDYTLPCIRL